MTEILNETALPGRDVGQRRYLRSKSDPTVLICGETGNCFARRDGLRWEYPGYKVDTDADGRKHVTHAGAYCDHESYSPQDAAA